ncbi:hypothetical protein NT6N_28400 [Oceaniferula spumae]|uniref:Uncharacterized protein n=1 Tax=Oceaniferula spumae TaxID=2979115 RepID=A0AAT9FP65_9BACT
MARVKSTKYIPSIFIKHPKIRVLYIKMRQSHEKHYLFYESLKKADFVGSMGLRVAHVDYVALSGFHGSE